MNQLEDKYNIEVTRMNLTIILRNITKKIYDNNQAVFLVDVVKQKWILSRFSEPKDLFERSYFQYKCQMKKQSALLLIVQSIAASVLLPVYYIKLTLARKNITKQIRENCAIFFTDGISAQIIPECLSKDR
jgi:hypothetical protein